MECAARSVVYMGHGGMRYLKEPTEVRTEWAVRVRPTTGCGVERSRCSAARMRVSVCGVYRVPCRKMGVPAAWDRSRGRLGQVRMSVCDSKLSRPVCSGYRRQGGRDAWSSLGASGAKKSTGIGWWCQSVAAKGCGCSCAARGRTVAEGEVGWGGEELDTRFGITR